MRFAHRLFLPQKPFTTYHLPRLRRGHLGGGGGDGAVAGGVAGGGGEGRAGQEARVEDLGRVVELPLAVVGARPRLPAPDRGRSFYPAAPASVSVEIPCKHALQ